MSDLIGLATQLDSEDFDNLPVIRAVASEIRNACLNAGFFFIKNHGVPTQVVEGAFESAKGFFGQEPDVKETVDIHKSDNFRGYMKLLSENNDPSKKGEVHEAFNLGLDKSLDSTLSHIEKEEEVAGQLKHSENLWPEESAWSKAGQFKSAVLSYYAALLALGQSLFPLFALALDLPEDFFDDKIRHPAAIMRLLRYPGTPREERKEENPGIGAHTDFECFTILAQGGKGLEVQNRKGQWIEAPMIPNAFVLNIGDQFARWTNGIFQSTRHRVLPPVEERYSIPFFFGCDHDVPLIPPVTCVSEERPARYEVMTAGAYVHMRLSETYGAKKEH